ncbi:hypothetical protein ACFWHT_08190 [Microbacterium sp. NPDC058342]|uniref:hypothetical protein n=1 Tax=Microbacterium sp. NPDC058342 TaxID=3346454 RepID=UPI003655BE53
MVTQEITVVLRSLFTTDEQTRQWMAAARTPETRARIRQWVRIEALGLATFLLGLSLVIVAVVVSIATAMGSGIGNAPPALFWWSWGVAIGVTACGAVGWVIAIRKREAACFADDQLVVGTVDRVIEHPGSGDDHTWFDLRLSTVLPDGKTLRRRLHLEGEHLDRRLGSRLRFRHNTLDADAFDDVHFVGWLNKKQPRPGRGRSAR